MCIHMFTSLQDWLQKRSLAIQEKLMPTVEDPDPFDPNIDIVFASPEARQQYIDEWLKKKAASKNANPA